MSIKKIIYALSHACMIMAIMLMTFFVIERFNSSMEFMTSQISQWFFLLFAVCTLILAILSIIDRRKQVRLQRLKQVAMEDFISKSAAASMSFKPSPVDKSDKMKQSECSQPDLKSESDTETSSAHLSDSTQAANTAADNDLPAQVEVEQAIIQDDEQLTPNDEQTKDDEPSHEGNASSAKSRRKQRKS